MAIQFPSNPTNGQTYTVGSTTYSYNATYGVWDASVAASGTQTYANIADLPLTDNTTGAQAFVSENNRLYIWSGTGWYNIALVNTSPTAITGNNGGYTFATDGTPIEITLVSSDPEGIPLTWSYSVTSGSLTNGGGTTATVSQVGNIFTITPTTTEDYGGVFSLTFTASDGVNLATTTSFFTLQFAILNSKYTSLMLKTSSTNAQQNNTFVDSSPNNFTITSTGNTTQGTFSPYGNMWSNYFAAGSDKLEIADDTNLGVFNGDYTIECWAYSVVSQTTSSGIAGKGGSSTGWTLNVTGATLLMNYGGSASFLSSSSGLFTVGEWHHVAVCRTGSTINLFCDGVIIDSATRSNDDNTNQPIRIGTNRIDSSKFKGYISNFRIVGSALYTSNFTPSTKPLNAIAGTVLLTCQSNRIKDNSTNNFAITKSGNVKVERFSPFNIESYAPTVIGGSAYFDGSGDYLTGASSNEFIASGNGFTAECWVYYTSISNYSFILASTTGANNYNPYWHIGSTNTGNWRISWGDASSVDTGVAIKTNSWNHVAMSMASNGSGTLYVNGTSIATTTGKTLNGAATAIAIAHGGGSLAGQYLVSGYVSDVRYVKNSSVYTGNFTPPTAPLTAIANTSLLLKNTNAGIYDSSGNNDIETVGNAQVSTAVVKYGSGSMYFDGSGDYLRIADNTALDMADSDFTMEFWINPQVSTSVAGQTVIGKRGSGGTIAGVLVGYWNSNLYPTIYATFNGTAWGINALTSSIATPQGQWSHVAVTRNGSIWKIWVNGVEGATTTASGTVPDNASQLSIGATSEDGSDTIFTSYISDLRITKGLARYTANFTPPTSELSV